MAPDRNVAAVLVLAGSLLVGSSASAGPIVFTFEGAEGPLGPPGTSYTETQQGLTITATWLDPGYPLAIQDLSPFGSSRALHTFYNDDSEFPVNVDFSAPVNGVSIAFGDFGYREIGEDFDDTVMMWAYSGPGGTGSLLGTAVGSWGDRDLQFDAFGWMTIVAPGIRSIQFIGGSVQHTTRQSLYWDNLTIVPEPTTLILLGTGLGVSAALSRRRRRRG